MIEGLSHITFVVRDLDRMTRILETVLGARQVYSSGERTFSISREKFFLAGGIWIAIMEGDPPPRRGYDHIALKIDEATFDTMRDRIVSLGLKMHESRPRIPGEGRSIYFHDDDNHLFELHTGTLQERLRCYAHMTENEE